MSEILPETAEATSLGAVFEATLRLYRPHWKMIAALSTLGLVAGLLLTFVVPKKYRSTSTVLFPSDSAGLSLGGITLPGGGSLKDSSSSGLLSLGIGPVRTPTADLAESVLRSRGATIAVYEQLDLGKRLDLPGDRDRAIDKILTKHLSLSKKKPTLSIEVVAPDPKLAHDILDAYLSYYAAYSNSKVLTGSKRQRLFLEQQLKTNSAERNNAEKMMVKFENGPGSKLLEAQPDMRAKYLPELWKTLVDAETRYRAAQAKYQQLQEGSRASTELASTDPFYPDPEDKVLLEEQTQLATAETQLATLRKERTEIHPDVIVARERVAAAELQVSKRLAATGRAIQRSLTRDQIMAEAELRGAEAAYQSARQRVSEARQLVRDAPQNLATQHRYLLNLSFRQELQKMLQLELERAKILESKESMELELLDPPSVPTHAFFPKKTYFGLAGMGIGFAMGVFLAWLKSRIPQSLETH